MSPAGLAGGAGVAEVAEKLDRVREWLAGSGYGAALFTTQPGVAWVTGGLEDRVVRNEEPGQAAYRSAGFDGEWREHVQGGPIGYLSREFDVVPGTPRAAEVIARGAAFAWNPTVRGAKSEDTFVVGRSGDAVAVTNTADWPVTASGRPAILVI